MSRRGRWRGRATRRMAAAGLAVLLAGRAARATDPPAPPPLPLGAAMHQIFAAQAEAAAQDQFTFYELEWLTNSSKLGPAGQVHLGRVIGCLSRTGYAVVLEPNPDPKLNVERRDRIVNALLAAGVPDAQARVVVAPPLAEGLYGEESVPLYPLLITTRFRNFFVGRGRAFGTLGGLGGFGLGGFGGYGLGGYGLGGYGFGYGLGGFGYGGYGPSSAQGYRGLGY